mgnify:FL=1
MIVADSGVLIDSLRGRKPMVDRVALELKKAALATTVVNCFEIVSGAKNEPERKKVEKLLAAFVILPVDEAAGLRLPSRLRRNQKGRAALELMHRCRAPTTSTQAAENVRIKTLPGVLLNRSQHG